MNNVARSASDSRNIRAMLALLAAQGVATGHMLSHAQVAAKVRAFARDGASLFTLGEEVLYALIGSDHIDAQFDRMKRRHGWSRACGVHRAWLLGQVAAYPCLAKHVAPVYRKRVAAYERSGVLPLRCVA